MSLKFVHQIIIFAGIGISLFFAWWCFTDPGVTGDIRFRIAGVVCIFLAFALVGYEIHFLKKTRRLII